MNNGIGIGIANFSKDGELSIDKTIDFQTNGDRRYHQTKASLAIIAKEVVKDGTLRTVEQEILSHDVID